MSTAWTSVEIFCSYAHEDEVWLRKLETHLSLLKRQGLVSLWHDRLLAPGTDWAQAIDASLETVSVILLLVSADFLASDYCYGIEMKRALARQQAGEVQVIPILLRPADWETAPFAHLHTLPTNAKPITTWSNEDTALADVAAGIRRILEELPRRLSANASRTSLPAIWNIPYPRNPFFLGRDAELARLHRSLQTGQATALSHPQAISGLGGIGKTQLALEYAYRYHQNYQAVLWGHAESHETLTASFVAIASLLQLPEREAPDQEGIVQAVRRWLQTHHEWLFILDNADDLVLVTSFLPSTRGGSLLLTTRAVTTGRLAHRVEIETLSPTQGALLLLRRSGLLEPDANLIDASQEERKQAERLSEELGGLPLALDQVGAYLEETGIDLAGYWHLYQQHGAELLQERRGLVADYPASVATTWSLAFAKVADGSEAASDLLRVCAFLSPDAIAEEILVQGAPFFGSVLASVVADAFHLNQVIEVLRAYSLVRRDAREKTLSIHRLVQAVLQDRFTPEERRLWAERTILAVNAAFPHAEAETWAQCERLLLQALSAAERIEQYHVTDLGASRLLSETATYLWDHARYTEAEPLYQRALAISEQQVGPEHPQVVYSLNGLANLYAEQGRYTEAEPLYQRALAISEQQVGPEHPQVAIPLNGLADIYKEQGKYAEAESFSQRALTISEQHLGPEHPQVTIPLNNLASLYFEQGKYTEAESFYRRALAISEQQMGPEHPQTAIPLNGLASLYKEQGKYTEAESFYERALTISEQQVGPEHPQVAYPLRNLANLYKEQGKYAEAESFYQRALRIYEQQVGPEHPQVTFSLNGLANLYKEQGKYAEAELLYQRSLRIREQQLGPEHAETSEAVFDLALFREAQGNRQDARSLYQRALSIQQQVLGPEHPKTKATHQHLTALLQSLGREAVAPPQNDTSPEQSEHTI